MLQDCIKCSFICQVRISNKLNRYTQSSGLMWKTLFCKVVQLFSIHCVCVYVLCQFNSLWPRSLLGSSAHGIFQERLLGCVASGSFQPSDLTCISCSSIIGRWILYHCDTWEELWVHRCILLEAYMVAKFDSIITV